MAVARAEEQVFPAVTRVIYGKPTLLEVVCQVRFPTDLRLEQELPVDFQQRVREMYPLLNRRTQSVVASLPPEVAKALEVVAPPLGTSTVWQFATEDGKTRLELTKENLTLISQSYVRWEQFWEQFRRSLDAFVGVYQPPFLVRIGLRYKNLIRRSVLDLNDVPWNELLSTPILGELASNGVLEHVTEATRNMLLTLPDREAKLRLQHGFAQLEGSEEPCYMIDCDLFIGRSDVNNANSAIEYLHQHAARYFKWCITDRLHEAMVPRPISD